MRCAELFASSKQIDPRRSVIIGPIRVLFQPRKNQVRHSTEESPDYDRERNAIQGIRAKIDGGFGGEIYDVGYTRAMLQAALSL